MTAYPKIKKGFTKQTICTCLRNELVIFTAVAAILYGIVYKIERGNKFDIIQIRCGFDKKTKIRQVIVIDNHARRQILTLKRGQWCHVLAEPRIYKIDVETKDGKQYKAPKWHFFAYMIQGLYVPKMFDVKKREEEINSGEEIDYIDEMNPNEEKTINDIIDGLFEENEELRFESDTIEYE